MNEKTYQTLELDKILSRLATYADFSASQELLHTLRPANTLEEAQRRLDETTEARLLMDERGNISVGGARDVRPLARSAERGMTLTPEQLLDVKGTLQASAVLKRTIQKAGERFPLLNEIAYNLEEGRHIVAAVERAIDDYGQIIDDASPRLAEIRRELRIVHDRLRSKLQMIVNSSRYAPFLQDTVITMRSGRYVIPIKAEAKGSIRGIVHDQSSSGATLFIEPLETVEINNRIREMESAEQEEIQRILRELTALVAAEADRIVWTVEALAQIDAIFARARYAGAIDAEPPQLVDFAPAHFPGHTLRLYDARHPLIDPEKVVPIDVVMDDETYMLIITGPNTGGKTVTLKTVGLLTLMAQCGLHIPASAESVLTVFHSVYADIGDEQSIEKSLSTFSGHLTNINEILAQADRHSLVLIDELGAGTDPAEGAAIARAILNELLQRGVTTLVATHYPELKIYAQNTPGVRNASVEFDVETLSPTYRLIIGLPGRSNAIAIATRLGLPLHIIEEARSYVGESDLKVDDLLDEIHRTRDENRQAQARLAAAEAEITALQAELKERLQGIEAERAQVLAEAEAAARAELADIYADIKELRRRLRTMSPTVQARISDLLIEAEEAARSAETLGQLIDTPAPKKAGFRSAAGKGMTGKMQVGDHVYVASLNAEGEVLSITDEREAEVQVGSLRVRVSLDGLERRAGPKKREDEPLYEYAGDVAVAQPASPGLELQIRGMTAEQAIPLLEDYLDRAYLAGLPWCRIIHGKGTGVLRKVVREVLRSHPLVREYKTAPLNEGGDGATVVYFVPLN